MRSRDLFTYNKILVSHTFQLQSFKKSSKLHIAGIAVPAGPNIVGNVQKLALLQWMSSRKHSKNLFFGPPELTKFAGEQDMVLELGWLS